jgi:CheY-like chemotaxis protein
MSSLDKTILIVDDEADVRNTLSEALELDGYKTIVVSGGRDALKVLKGPEKPSLIFLDLMMPEMDGFEFIRTRDLNSEMVGIPIVVISASGRLDTKLAGCNVKGYLKKPIDLYDLLETAEKYCG